MKIVGTRASGKPFWLVPGFVLIVAMASLNFRDSSHIRIRYRLLGVESDWVQTAGRTVRYPRLEPGAYRFQAEAVDGTGGAASQPREISFVITPLWWQSGPLRLALMLALIAATFHHLQLGLQVVIEDYVPQEGIKFAAVLAVKGLCVLLALICAISALILGLNP